MDNPEDTLQEADRPPLTPDLSATPIEKPVRLIVERLEAMSHQDSVTIGDITESFGRTSFLPMMLIPALMLVSPLSGIPLFSSFCGIWIVVVAMQRIARRDRLWLPGFIMERTIQGASLNRASHALCWVADWLDRTSRPRLHVLVTPPVSLFSYSLCVLAGLTIPFLELIPFSSSLIGLMVVLLSVGLLVRDGLFVILALILGAVMATLPVFVVSQVVN
ncbi:exopolysaccharide biosynthesis protein [Oceaniglobus ichthyenteri]|uniref:exopolysaccharide biosynthesis protein n=1 Tax=Oceaniglobus ichthyenteri TaxID=2136177 RepID=UPI001F0BD8F3|nr:exopolysaccharide biosynthesis protein [Oceaniglobus ichthyenteri]